MSSRLLPLQCAVRQLCAGEPRNERWHNSHVNHPLQHWTAVRWWSLLLRSGGGFRVGKGVAGPCLDTKDVCVGQAPAGRDYRNLCHLLNWASNWRRGCPRLLMERSYSGGRLAEQMNTPCADLERNQHWQPQRGVTCCVGLWDLGDLCRLRLETPLNRGLEISVKAHREAPIPLSH